jgi:protein-tyrosine phosphatase
MSLSGLCDLHCHYVPNVDDGVRSAADGLALCRSLKQIGYSTVIATPHMRSGMFDNDKPGLVAAFERYALAARDEPDLPELGLAAEHYFDDTFVQRLGNDQNLPYPGGHAALVEFSPEQVPIGADEVFFRMQVRGVRPVIAHPERYAPIWQSDQPLTRLVALGALALLDVMSLVGKYGKKPQQTAERLLKAGCYYAACSDSHKPADVEQVARGIERLIALRGQDEARRLLAEHPRRILSGSVVD